MKHSLLIGIIVVTGLLICGCINNNSSTINDTIPKDKFVAVLEDYNNYSFLIGNTTYPPVRPWPIPAPVFPFPFGDNETLYPMSDYPRAFGNNISVNDSLKILVGKRLWTDTPTVLGSGGGSLNGVYSLPYTIENVFTVLKVTKDGTITAIYDNQTINLKPGEKWTGIIFIENTTGAYLANIGSNSTSFNPSETTKLPWPVTNEISVTITNRGIFDKAIFNN